MTRVGLDTETHLLKDGLLAPRLVCASWRDPRAVPMIGLAARAEALAWFRRQVRDAGVVLVAHNATFDLAVLAAEDRSLVDPIFEAYSDGRVECTMVRQKLLDVARGEAKMRVGRDGKVARPTYSLEALAYYWLGASMEKGADSWQTRFASLDGVPVDRWPEDARRYASQDAEYAWLVGEEQRAWALRELGGELPNQPEQYRAAWVLHLCASWAVRVDGRALEALRASLDQTIDVGRATLRAHGVVRADGSCDMKLVKRMVVEAFERLARGEDPGSDGGSDVPEWVRSPEDDEEPVAAAAEAGVPLTAKGHVSTSRATLLATRSPVLATLATVGKALKVRSTYVDAARRGVDRPLTSRPNVLVETGRTSWSGPNLQNPPTYGGFRECFVARPGKVLAFADYAALEMATLAQVCLDLFGTSRLADAINAGDDLHHRTSTTILGRAYEDLVASAGEPIVKAAREVAKKINYGVGGGMGAERFVGTIGDLPIPDADGNLLRGPARVPRARELIRAWKDLWDMWRYFDKVQETVGDRRARVVTQLRSGRLRGDVGYCDCANGWFQGLAADGAKEALWLVSRACYVDRASSLYGARIVLFLHDEVAVEVDAVRGSEAAAELGRLMVAGMRRYVPDVRIEAEPSLHLRWYKGGRPARVESLLVPSRPSVGADGRTTWVYDDGGRT